MQEKEDAGGDRCRHHRLRPTSLLTASSWNKPGKKNSLFLGKAKGRGGCRAYAASFIRSRIHQVFTGVTILLLKKGKRPFTSARMCMSPNSPIKEIADYIATKDPMDKAGAYGIQGIFAKHISLGSKASYSNVVGTAGAVRFIAS